MPGLVGLITRMPPERASRELHQMVQTLRHEPFYETGTWSDDAMGVYVGWALRKSPLAGSQPLLSSRGDVALVFSGEAFPPRGAAGPETTSLVDRYQSEPGFLTGLHGRFQG